MLEALRSAMFEQAVHLRHTGTRSNQHQRTVRQLGQMRIAKGHLQTRHTVALQLSDQFHRTVLAGQHVQLDVAPAVGC
ncbi:hypothetical protein D3C75_1260180 [compost metagenome]